METCPADLDLAGLLYPQCICCLPTSYSLTICCDVISISEGLSNLTLPSHFPKTQTCYSPAGSILLIEPYHRCVCIGKTRYYERAVPDQASACLLEHQGVWSS